MTLVTEGTTVLPWNSEVTYPSGALDELPDSLLRKIVGEYNVTSPKLLISYRKINKRFYFILSYNCSGVNKLWKKLVFYRWPYVSKKFKLSRWDKFYEIRLEKEKEKSNYVSDILNIENCDFGIPEEKENTVGLPKGYKWRFKCPYLSQWTKSGSYKYRNYSKTEYCGVCKKSVYIVKTEKELKSHVSQNHCIIVDLKGTYGYESESWEGEIDESYHSINEDLIKEEDEIPQIIQS